VTGVLGIPPAFVREQIDTLFGDVRIDAVKIGMVGQAPVIRAVADAPRALEARARRARPGDDREERRRAARDLPRSAR
jgi:hypothetical protein